MTVDRIVEREGRDAPCRTHQVPLGMAVERRRPPARAGRARRRLRAARRPLRLRRPRGAADRRRAARSWPRRWCRAARPAGRDGLRRPARAGAHGRGRAAAPHAARADGRAGAAATPAPTPRSAWRPRWAPSSAGTARGGPGGRRPSAPRRPPRAVVARARRNFRRPRRLHTPVCHARSSPPHRPRPARRRARRARRLVRRRADRRARRHRRAGRRRPRPRRRRRRSSTSSATAACRRSSSRASPAAPSGRPSGSPPGVAGDRGGRSRRRRRPAGDRLDRRRRRLRHGDRRRRRRAGTARSSSGGGASGLAIDMGINGAAYVVWARARRGTTSAPRGCRAERGSGIGAVARRRRPRSRPAAGGCARAWPSPPRATPSRPGARATPTAARTSTARRLTGLTLSAVAAGPLAPRLRGRPAGGDADSPDIDIEDDGSYAWVVFRQDIGGRSRTIARRLVGSLFEAPAAIDGGAHRVRAARGLQRPRHRLRGRRTVRQHRGRRLPRQVRRLRARRADRRHGQRRRARAGGRHLRARRRRGGLARRGAATAARRARARVKEGEGPFLPEVVDLASRSSAPSPRTGWRSGRTAPATSRWPCSRATRGRAGSRSPSTTASRGGRSG